MSSMVAWAPSSSTVSPRSRASQSIARVSAMYGLSRSAYARYSSTVASTSIALRL